MVRRGLGSAQMIATAPSRFARTAGTTGPDRGGGSIRGEPGQGS
ncbi:hypothetical protein ASZ90_009682 [hydrocarbon metagenome]|uniref:Uncharacterized protein n=1 Tax=hydrocarbon metagenome TaxID=938273 RepID=A0A0W8FI40_9ZZZZ